MNKKFDMDFDTYVLIFKPTFNKCVNSWEAPEGLFNIEETVTFHMVSEQLKGDIDSCIAR